MHLYTQLRRRVVKHVETALSHEHCFNSITAQKLCAQTFLVLSCIAVLLFARYFGLWLIFKRSAVQTTRVVILHLQFLPINGKQVDFKLQYCFLIDNQWRLKNILTRRRIMKMSREVKHFILFKSKMYMKKRLFLNDRDPAHLYSPLVTTMFHVIR